MDEMFPGTCFLARIQAHSNKTCIFACVTYSPLMVCWCCLVQANDIGEQEAPRGSHAMRRAMLTLVRLSVRFQVPIYSWLWSPKPDPDMNVLLNNTNFHLCGCRWPDSWGQPNNVGIGIRLLAVKTTTRHNKFRVEFLQSIDKTHVLFQQ